MVCQNGETCIDEVCIGGSKASCEGNVEGEYCDAINSKCKCSKDLEECQENFRCTNEKCGRYLYQ